MTDVYQRVGFVIAGAAIGAALHKLLQKPTVRSEITVPGQEGALPKRAKSGKVSEVSLPFNNPSTLSIGSCTRTSCTTSHCHQLATHRSVVMGHGNERAWVHFFSR